MARRSAAEIKEEETPAFHPKLAEQLVAHADAERQLLTLIHSGKLPHAILLTGPRGIGKATLAYRLARFLLAPADKDAGLFGAPPPANSLHLPASHPTFRRMVAGGHPDFLAIEADDIKVEEARTVAQFLNLTPAESDWRVVVIDTADAMNRNAANALLKTLEEPPPRTVLILISHNPGTLLPTIRSRCRTLRLAPLSSADFSKVMSFISSENDSTDAPMWALLSGGSPGVALSLMDSKADIIYKDLLERGIHADTLKNHSFADRFARKDSQRNWQVLCRLYLWLLTRIASKEEGEVFSGERVSLERLRKRKTLAEWLDLWERAGKLLSDTDHLHLDKKQTVLTLLKALAE